MTRCVLDSSIALAWMLPDEGDYATEQLLGEVAAAGAAAPGLFVQLHEQRVQTPTQHLPALPYGELVVPLLVTPEGERAATDLLGWC